MTKSLQEIEDYYVRQGLKGEVLRNALNDDLEYQRLLKKRKLVIRNKYGITEAEERDYILPNEEDYQILSRVKSLDNKKLSKEDRETVEIIKSQLKDDWRAPLISKLQHLLEKYD